MKRQAHSTPLLLPKLSKMVVAPPAKASSDGAAMLPPGLPLSLPQVVDLKGDQDSSLGCGTRPGEEDQENHGSTQEDTSSSFLQCVVCSTTPSGPPLLGCCNGHIVCSTCRVVVCPPSCPVCGQQDLGVRLTVAESLLAQELEAAPQPCPYQVMGCRAQLGSSGRSQHMASCLFRPVRCPKAMFSSSCLYKGPYCTIQEHGRSQHGLHRGFTELEQGLFSSKMFDKGLKESTCDDDISARFQPLELVVEDHMFYVYYERLAARGLWLFFVRHYGAEKPGVQWKATIMVGGGGMKKEEHSRATSVWKGKVAPYKLGKEEIRGRGLVLGVADEVMRAGKVDNIIFRMWVKVERVVKRKRPSGEV